jgi:CRP-like cAMP-binding protein
MLENNISDDLGSINWHVDLYSHFKDLGLVRKMDYDVDLWPFYDKKQGWNRDKIDHVIDLLKKVRFFNRFDDESLKMMLTKVTLRRLKRNSVLFFKGEEAAIVVSGTLHLLCHEENLACPNIACTYNPGDVIGLNIDNGWSDAQHSWICAWEECDVFMISDGYLNFMWDNMKKFSSNLVADILDEAPHLSELSEQALFTIAHDIARFREYRDGDIIIH